MNNLTNCFIASGIWILISILSDTQFLEITSTLIALYFLFIGFFE